MEKNILKSPSNGASTEIQTIKDDLVSLKDDAVTLARDINDGGKSIAREGLEQLRTTSDREFHKVEAYVKEHPGQSVLLAFATGLAASYLLGSRR